MLPDWSIDFNKGGIIWNLWGLQNSNIVCFRSKIGRNVMREFTIPKRSTRKNIKKIICPLHQHIPPSKKTGRGWRERTHSPYSQIDSFAIFQHKSTSSLTFPNLRPLFAPRVAFFSSFDICFLWGPVLGEYPCWRWDWRETWVVDLSAASSSGRFCVLYEIRNLEKKDRTSENDSCRRRVVKMSTLLWWVPFQVDRLRVPLTVQYLRFPPP